MIFHIHHLIDLLDLVIITHTCLPQHIYTILLNFIISYYRLPRLHFAICFKIFLAPIRIRSCHSSSLPLTLSMPILSVLRRPWMVSCSDQLIYAQIGGCNFPSGYKAICRIALPSSFELRIIVNTLL